MSIKNPFAHYIFWLVILLMTAIGIKDAVSQCNTLRSQFDISFNTDQDCAPTSVTDYTITYSFNVAQNPNSIGILFEWNDPANSTTFVDIGSGLIASAGDTKFTATATFTYPVNNECGYFPTAFVLINGAVCPTSEQQQRAFSWARDNEFGGNLSITPEFYDVCYGDAVTNAVFADDSFFNCNLTAEPDNPNRQQRHVQFVYGTNHNAGNSIRDLSLNDGGVQNLTDGTGALATTDTRGTGGLLITAAYFGPVDAIPFPADGPLSVSFPINAPANAANAVGSVFEVTMFNWNVCNPFNGNAADPNYDEAISTTAYVRIVDAPTPDFLTRKDNAAGVVTTDFCIGDIIYFDNESVGADSYSWEFFDDNTGTVSLATSNANNPTFSYSTSGQKLIRLTATNNAAQSNCMAQFDVLVNITPSLVAQIETTDLAGNPITPAFCQDPANPQTFDVRFEDISVGTVTPTTRWRWEFYDENNTLIREEPGPGYSSNPLGPFDLSYINIGVYRARLRIKDAVTDCENIYETEVIVYENPVADFVVDRVCEGSSTHFTDQSTLNAINGEIIVSWEWDFDYDGVTFNKDAAFDNQVDFDRTYPAAGTYEVALRIMTDQNGCSDFVTQTVVVDPMPIADITADNNNDCSVLTVNFTNNGVGSQPDVITQYIWEIDEGSGYVVDSIQDPSDANFSDVFTRDFENLTTANKTFDVRLRAVTQRGCETVSAPISITVLPGPRSGFSSLNYSPFADNCSPVSVDFAVDPETQSLNPTDYTWTINDENGQIFQQSTGTIPSFTYSFENNSQSIKNFDVTLSSTLPSGCSGDSTRVIRINPVPDGTMALDTLTLDCEIMQVKAEALQKGLTEYKWVVKENGVIINTITGTNDEITHLTTRNNSDIEVSIELITENFAGCESAQTIENYTVPASYNINADFDVSPLVQTLPNSTVDIVNTTNDGPWTYLWDFGDGNTSTAKNIGSYTYETYGDYTITLTISLNECVKVVAKTVKINPIPPMVDFDFNVASGCAPLTIRFENLSQYAEPDSYFWDFGEGEGTSVAADPVHTYYEPGLYTVSLTASNILEDTITKTKTDIIRVYPQPVAAFEVRPAVVLVPDNPIYLANRSTGASSFTWEFGDGNSSNEAEPIHYYQEEGVYDIALIAQNSSGCADTLTRKGIVEAKAVGRILIPNAFSPDPSGPSGGEAGGAPGANDIFLPKTQQVKEFEMLIFNRWGELLFRSTNKGIGWDGYYKGKLMPQDVYVYKLSLVFDSGESATRVGDVNLIR
ncbi:PKD domain-containing protein [Fulvivirga sp. RKSG066]|uniref:PKD domain-containing protein n=1 Tax=Fulvivirga aurantia TaxID=2529383 RepID=UPI0012BD40D8|nr:PKD domain-containing protein [Fulvivirga aurantia]MTI22575.1 PKD domain-containing protein [Fulvivirga aurantia]